MRWTISLIWFLHCLLLWELWRILFIFYFGNIHVIFGLGFCFLLCGMMSWVTYVFKLQTVKNYFLKMLLNLCNYWVDACVEIWGQILGVTFLLHLWVAGERGCILGVLDLVASAFAHWTISLAQEIALEIVWMAPASLDYLNLGTNFTSKKMAIFRCPFGLRNSG